MSRLKSSFELDTREQATSECEQRENEFLALTLWSYSPDSVTPSSWWPAWCYAAKHSVGIRQQGMNDFRHIGVIGIVQHEVAAGSDFADGVFDAGSPGASVHQNKVEGAVRQDVDGTHIVIHSHTGVVVIVY